MNESQWILDRIVIAVHQILIAEHGGSAGIRDRGLFESALARPKQLYAYK
jgi:death-on-curing protein